MITSKQIQTVLIDLMERNLFLCDFGENKSCLKNERDEVVFSFQMVKDMTTLQSLRFSVNKLKAIIDESFKLIE